MTVRLSPESVTEMGRRVAEQQSLKEIMAEMGVGVSVIKRYFPDYRGRFGMSGRPLGADRLATIKEMLDDGASVNETSRTLGVCHKTIKHYVPGAGWGRGGGSIAGEYRKLSKRLDAL